MEYVFGDFTLDLTRGELVGSGGPIAIEPRAFGLLTFLVENHGRLVTKDELVDGVWDGRIVSDSAISTAVKAARRALGDDGSGQTWLKTIRGRGFRFDGDIAQRVATNSQDVCAPHLLSEPTRTPMPPSVSERKTASMAIFDRPSVLVLGFDCLGNDSRDTSLAMGLAQEVRLNLSNWRCFPVIGPEALAYKTGSEIDIRAKAQELGAGYALSGAVRSMGDVVRVNVTLMAVETGGTIWSHHFDGQMENIFDFEEEVSRAIVSQIEPEISRLDSQRLLQSRPTVMSAWQLLLEAGEAESRGGQGYGTKETTIEQIELVKAALEKDATLARAWAWLAKCYWQMAIMGWADDRDEAINATLDASQTALEINPTNWMARCHRATALVFGRKEFIESEFHAREAVRLNPSDANARHILGCVLENVGKTDEAMEHLEAVFRLNPNHPNAAGVLGDMVTCQMLLGRAADSVETAVRLITFAPNYARGIQRAIAAFADAGELDRAWAAVPRLRAIQPDFDEAYVRNTYPFQDPAVLERFVGALHSAGAFQAD